MSTMQGISLDSMAWWDECTLEDEPCFAESHDEMVKATHRAFFSCGCKRLYCQEHMDRAIEIKYNPAKIGLCMGFGQHKPAPSDMERWEKI